MTNKLQTLAYYEQFFQHKTITLDDGLAVSYRESHPDAEKTIVVIHGITGTHYSMLQMAGVWAERGAHVIALDLPGHGGSDRIHAEHFKDVADWLHRVFAYLSLEKAFTLVGNSFGSAVCYSYLSHYNLPAGSTVVLGAPTPTISKLSTRLEQASKLFPERLLNYAYYRNRLVESIRMRVLLADIKNDHLRDRLRESLRSEAKLVQHKYAMTLTGLMARDKPFFQPLHSIEVQQSIIVVHGDTDRIAHPEVNRYMHEILPHATIIEAPNSGHLVHIEALESLNRAVGF